MQPESQSISPRVMVPALFVAFIDSLGISFIIPFIPTIMSTYAVSATMATSLIIAYALTQAGFSFVLGRLSDRASRPMIIGITLAVMGIGFIAMGSADSFAGLFALRMLTGAGSGNIAVAQAHISNSVPAGLRANALGRFGFANVAGYMGGLTLSTLALALVPPSLAFSGLMLLVGSLALLLGAAVLLGKSDPSPKFVDETLAPQRRGLIRRIAVIVAAHAALSLAIFAFYLAIPIWMNTKLLLPEAVGGGALLACTVLGGVAQTLGLPMVRSWMPDARAVIVFGGVFCAALVLLGATGAGLASLATALALASFSCGVMAPLLQAQIGAAANADEQGAAFGVAAIGANGAAILAPLMAGYFLDGPSPGLVFFATAMIGALSLLIAAVWFRSARLEPRLVQP